MKHQKIIIVVAVVCLIIGGLYLAGIFAARSESFSLPFRIPFVERVERQTREWSIGIYTAKDPFNFTSPGNISNPVLTADDVTDVNATFVADPFMLRENNTWYMFFEVFNTDTHQGDIGLATSSDGFNWTYEQIVLDEPFHLSYPGVFKKDNEYYMIPETGQANSIRLYKANSFPKEWSFVKTLLTGYYVDSTIFRYNGKWWIFAETNPKGNDTLSLYYSNNLMGPWTEHPKSPIIEGNANIARPGGRVVTFDGRIIRYTQDDAPTYGNQVRAFEIDVLTTLNYEEHEVYASPVLETSGIGKKRFESPDWNTDGMHHIDTHQISQNEWIACVDGLQVSSVFEWYVQIPIPFIKVD